MSSKLRVLWYEFGVFKFDNEYKTDFLELINLATEITIIPRDILY